MYMDCQRAGATDIPPDVWLYILKRYLHGDDRKRLACTCRFFDAFMCELETERGRATLNMCIQMYPSYHLVFYHPGLQQLLTCSPGNLHIVSVYSLATPATVFTGFYSRPSGGIKDIVVVKREQGFCIRDFARPFIHREGHECTGERQHISYGWERFSLRPPVHLPAELDNRSAGVATNTHQTEFVFLGIVHRAFATLVFDDEFEQDYLYHPDNYGCFNPYSNGVVSFPYLVGGVSKSWGVVQGQEGEFLDCQCQSKLGARWLPHDYPTRRIWHVDVKDDTYAGCFYAVSAQIKRRFAPLLQSLSWKIYQGF